jgi:hypothetical protein
MEKVKVRDFEGKTLLAIDTFSHGSVNVVDLIFSDGSHFYCKNKQGATELGGSPEWGTFDPETEFVQGSGSERYDGSGSERWPNSGWTEAGDGTNYPGEPNVVGLPTQAQADEVAANAQAEEYDRHSQIPELPPTQEQRDAFAAQAAAENKPAAVGYAEGHKEEVV